MKRIKPSVWDWLSLIVHGLTCAICWRSVSLTTSLLGTSSTISPDGFDWIIQGRALAAGFDGDLPVLRNPGFVVVSAADALAGGKGLVLATCTSLALVGQWVAFTGALRIAHVAPLPRFALVLFYFLSFIHFVDLYVLPDSIAVALLMMSLYCGLRGLTERRLKWIVTGVLLGAGGATFQLYAAAGIVGILLALLLARHRDLVSTRFVATIIGATVAFSAGFAAVKFVWERAIPHASVPRQLDLIEASLVMVPFYLNLWFITFLPLIALALIGRLRPRKSPDSWRLATNTTMLFAAYAPTAVLLVGLALLYQWPESRFSYSYIGIVTVILGTALFGPDDPVSGRDQLPSVEAAKSRLLVGLTLAVALILTPANAWQPRLEQLRVGAPWFAHGFHSPAPYAWYEAARAELCKSQTRPSPSDIDAVLSDLRLTDDYGRMIARFGLANCL
jgi:hypothetical protein